MKYFLAYLVALFCITTAAQKRISGESNSNFKFEPKYERGIPPNLFVDMTFEDGNGNGVMEPEESAELKLTISW